MEITAILHIPLSDELLHRIDTLTQHRERFIANAIIEYIGAREREKNKKIPPKDALAGKILFRWLMDLPGMTEGSKVWDGVEELLNRGGERDKRSMRGLAGPHWETFLRDQGIRVRGLDVLIALGRADIRRQLSGPMGVLGGYSGPLSSLEGAEVVKTSTIFDRVMNGYIRIPGDTARAVMVGGDSVEAPAPEAREEGISPSIEVSKPRRKKGYWLLGEFIPYARPPGWVDPDEATETPEVKSP